MPQDPDLKCPACGHCLQSLTSSVCPECGNRFALVRHPDSGGARPADWFVVGARLIGLWYLIDFVRDLRVLLDIAMGWYTPQTTSMEVYYGLTLLHAVVAGCLLLWAKQIASILFKPSRTDSEDHTPADSPTSVAEPKE